MRYATTGHYFYVANDGNAVNFLHGAAVGPFIFLVQAEILTALVHLSGGSWKPGYHELAESDRWKIAQTWLTYFNKE
jgi:adenosylhomocysteinase